MTKSNSLFFLAGLLLPQLSLGWSTSTPNTETSRRDALKFAGSAAFGSLVWTSHANAAEEVADYQFEKRDRNLNKDAVIRDDFWYQKGIAPPRKLNNPLVMDDPKWNTFGSCESSGSGAESTNSCTYISLKQRQPAYSKYGFSITQGARDLESVKSLLEAKDWNKAARYVFVNPETNLPPPCGISKELLVARFYVNEFKFGVTEIGNAIEAGDQARALAAWEFAKDSFNSYGQVINRQIVPKVGDKLPVH